MIELVAGGASDVGRVRAGNQDSWSIAERLWAVADGMGGHRGGEVASRMTIDVLAERFDDHTTAALLEVARTANEAIYERATDETELRGMGTTLCAMALVDTGAETQALGVINIGDSRCYQWRDGTMTQITRDHSLVEDMRAAGQITDAEAAVHPHRNIVTRALGIQPEVRIDAFEVVPATGDRYVLCSDGLFNEVSVDRISATLRRLADPHEAASELVRQANEAGGRDNVTVVVVDVVDATGAAPSPGGSTRDDASGRSPDMAGITTARRPGRRSAPDGGPRRAAKEPRVRLRLVSWRTFVFVIVLAAILGVAAAAVGWYSRGSFFVGLDRGQVTIFKGRPDKVLWFEPTVEQRTGIAAAQVPAASRDAVDAGKVLSTRAEADAYVAEMRQMICSNLTHGAKPEPGAPGGPTTTIPADCVVPTPGRGATTTTAPGSSVTTTVPAPPTTKPPVTTAR